MPRFLTPMVMISERPAEAVDRAVSGHWEGTWLWAAVARGDSAISALVERSTRFVMLIHLPQGRHRAEHFHQALTDSLGELPPRGTDLSIHSRAKLDHVAAELNSWPRKTLGWETLAERLTKLLTGTD